MINSKNEDRLLESLECIVRELKGIHKQVKLIKDEGHIVGIVE